MSEDTTYELGNGWNIVNEEDGGIGCGFSVEGGGFPLTAADFGGRLWWH